jgi:peptidyl-prolyl cis-trans isomerase C
VQLKNLCESPIYEEKIFMQIKSNRVITTAIILMLSAVLNSNPVSAQTASPVILKSKNIEITEAMLEAALEAIPSEDRAGINAAPKRIAEMLKGMLLNKTLVKEAEQSGLDKSPQVLAEIATARDAIIAKARLKEFEKQLVPPKYENSAREQYITQTEKYTIPSDIDSSHILFKTQCRTEQEALRLATELREKIINGKSFEEAAIELSEDSSVKKNKGNIGTLPANSLAKDYSAAAQLLKIGEISKPVVSEFGVHIIRLNKLTVGRKITFDEAKYGIIAEMEAKYKSAQRSQKMAEIEFDPSVKLNEELLRKRGSRTATK